MSSSPFGIHQLLQDKNVLHAFDLFFYNNTYPDSNTFGKFVKIPAVCVKELVFTESILNFGVSGYVVLELIGEFLERGQFSSDSIIKELPGLFTPRSDHQNFIHIFIQPVSEFKETLGKRVDSIINLWTASIDAVITSIDSYVTDNPTGTLYRRFHFQDVYTYWLKTHKIEWSSVEALQTKHGLLPDIVYKEPLSRDGVHADALNKFDKDKAIPAPEAIISILKTAGTNTFSIFEPGENVKVGVSPQNSQRGTPQLDWNFFEMSPEQNSKQFQGGGTKNGFMGIYVSSPINSAYEDLKHALKYCIDGEEVGGPSLLFYDRTIENKGWKLHGYTSFWKTKIYTDLIFLYESDSEIIRSGGGGTPIPVPTKKRFDISVAKKLFHVPTTSMIMPGQFQLSPLMAEFAADKGTTFTYKYIFADGAFQVHRERDDIEQVIEAHKKALKEGEGWFSLKKSDEILFTPSPEMKKDKRSILNHVYIPDQVGLDRFGSIDTLKKLFLLNQSCALTLPGALIRRPGYFFIVDSTKPKMQRNYFHDRYTGEWFIAQVTHSFQRERGYSNEILGIKVDSYDKLFETHEVFKV